jgi:hypothetical protein
MFTVARQGARTRLPLDLSSVLRLDSACAPSLIRPSADDLIARAVGIVGLAALSSLPLLLLASLALDAPLAGPSLIACGYLVVAFLLRTERQGRAAAMNAALLAALVAWSIATILQTEGSITGEGMAVALLAPLFAAAPALARSAISAARGRILPAVRSRTTGPENRPPSVIADDEHGRVSGRLTERLAASSAAAVTDTSGRQTSERKPAEDALPATFASDIAEATSFALRHARPKAEARRIILTAEVASGILAGCDRPTCRRIIRTLIEGAVARTPTGGSVHLSTRQLRGIVLLRIVSSAAAHCAQFEIGSDRSEAPDIANVRAMVEQAGGTLMVAGSPEGFTLSVRLDLAQSPTAETRDG